VLAQARVWVFLLVVGAWSCDARPNPSGTAATGGEGAASTAIAGARTLEVGGPGGPGVRYLSVDGPRLNAVLEAGTGKRLKLQGELPAGHGRAAALLVVPSQTELMDHPEHLELRRQAVAAGFASFGMDWASVNAQRGGPQSSEPEALSAEVAEIEVAAEAIAEQPRIDATRMTLVGRRLGAIAAYAVFRRRPTLWAAVLLDPPCIDGMMASRFPELASERRPVLVMVKDNAPVCPTRDFVSSQKGMPPNVRWVHYRQDKDGFSAYLVNWLRAVSNSGP
jgi:predicted esterase